MMEPLPCPEGIVCSTGTMRFEHRAMRPPTLVAGTPFVDSCLVAKGLRCVHVLQ